MEELVRKTLKLQQQQQQPAPSLIAKDHSSFPMQLPFINGNNVCFGHQYDTQSSNNKKNNEQKDKEYIIWDFGICVF